MALSGTTLTIGTILLKRGTVESLKNELIKAGEKAVVISGVDIGRTKTGVAASVHEGEEDSRFSKFSELPWDDELSQSSTDFSTIVNNLLSIPSTVSGDNKKSANAEEVRELANDIDTVKFDKANISTDELFTAGTGDDAGKITAITSAVTAGENEIGDDKRVASLARVKALAQALLTMINTVDTAVVDGVLTAVPNAELGDISAVTNKDKKAASVQDMVYAATRILALESVITIDGGEVIASPNP